MKRLISVIVAFVFLVSCQPASYYKKQADHAIPENAYNQTSVIGYQGPLAGFNPSDPVGSLGQQGSDYISGAIHKAITPEHTKERYGREMAWVIDGVADISEDMIAGQMQTALQSGAMPDTAAMVEEFQQKFAARSIDTALAAAQASKIPFLQNLELQYQLQKDQKPQFSARTIDAVYESEDLRHTVFAEGGLAREDGRTTMNVGMGYRYMNKAETWLYGVNAFYDRQWPYNHERGSLGLELTSAKFGIFANRYVPLSGWQDTRLGYQEKTLGGWDAGVTGFVPYLKNVELTGTGYVWDRYENVGDLTGLRLDAEYTPIPEITLGASVDHDNEGETQQNLFIRYNFNAEKVAREKSPASVADLRLRAVNRENRLLVQERQTPSLRGTVVETAGANSFSGPDGSGDLEVGMHIPYGSTITVGAGGGSYAELSFGDSGVLRIGTNSQVRVDIGLITLISGTMQFVSGTSTVVIVVPGGTVNLLGTDIDVVSNGASSTVRVRDGSVNAEGIIGNQGDIIELDGSPLTLVAGSPAYQSHEETVYENLDSIDPTALDVNKAAPYIFDVTINQAPAIVGDDLVLAVNFSKPVVLSGGVTLDFTINSLARSATYLSGNNSNVLLFTYTTVSADANQDQLTIDAIILNGGTIVGDGKNAIIYVPQSTLTFDSGLIIAVDVPVTVSTTAPNPTSTSPIPFSIVFDEAVTGLLVGELDVTNGTASNLMTADNITYTVDVTPAIQGTVSLQVPAGVAQSAGMNDNAESNLLSLVYNTGAPSGYAVAFTTDPINSINQTAAAFQMSSVEIGSTFEYEISSSGGGTNVTGSGTITTNPQSVTGINVSGLNDGTLTVGLTLTSPLMEVGPQETDTVIKDLVAPAITSVTPPVDGVYDDL